jgi:geranylgeranyl diphosphate synthase type II
MRPADELRDVVEAYLRALTFSHDLGTLEPALRYTLEAGGKRIRPVFCLAVTEAAGGDVEAALPAAGAVELVHTFSLVHDDLPAMDDDDERRGRPSAHVAFGEGVALLAGDALLAEAVRLALTYEDPAIARELVDATLGMIGGQHRDIAGEDVDLVELHRLKTGRLFSASVGLGLRVARVPEADQTGWRAFGAEVGLLFQLVDDLLDGDGFVAHHSVDEVRALADAAAARARDHLAATSADTSVLVGLVDAIASRDPCHDRRRRSDRS